MEDGMRRISVIAVIFMFLGICGGGYAQTPVEIHTGGNGAVSNTNPLYVAGSMTLSGGALETTQLLIQGILQGLSDKTVTTTQAANILTQLLKLKFTGEDLKTVFSNTSIGVTATDLDMRDLSQATDTIQVFQPDPSQAKFLMYGNTAKDGTGIFYVPKLDTDGHLQIDVLTLPAITGAVTSNSGTGWADSGIAKETGGNLADVKSNTDNIPAKGQAAMDGSTPVAIASDQSAVPVAFSDKTYSESIVELTLTDTGLWYDYALPSNTVSYDIKARTGYDFKVSKSDGGAYQTTWAGDALKRDVPMGVLSDTLYFNSPDSAGLILEIRVCIKNS